MKEATMGEEDSIGENEGEEERRVQEESGQKNVEGTKIKRRVEERMNTTREGEEFLKEEAETR